MARKRLELKAHLPEDDLKARYKSSNTAREARRWHALWLISQGYSPSEVGGLVGLSAYTVRRIITRYNAKGIAGVEDGHRANPGGRIPRLTATQEGRLLGALKGPPPEGGLWSGPKVAAWIERETGQTTYPQLGWVYLRRLGARLRVPRRRHAKAATKDEQEAFQKALRERVERVGTGEPDPASAPESPKEPAAEAPRSGLGDGAVAVETPTPEQATGPSEPVSVEVWAQDEARIGLKPILRRVWVLPGTKPLAHSWHKYEWLYVYAFVHPSSGRTEWFILPTVNTELMSLALKEFAHAVGAGPSKRILLVLDRAGWHDANDLEIPEGIELVLLPPYTPELQPAERLWPLMREAIANEAIADLDTLEEKLVIRIRQLIEQSATIQALTQFHWWPAAA